MTDTDFAAAATEIERAIDELRVIHPEPVSIILTIRALLDFDDNDEIRKRTLDIALTKEQCQQLYSLALTDMSAAMEFLFRRRGLWMPTQIRNTKVWIRKQKEDEAE